MCACVRACVHVFYTVYYVLNETHLASEARSFCLFECSLSHFKHPVSALHTLKKSADSLTEVNVSRATLWTSCSDIRRQSPNQFEDSWQMLLEELWWKSCTLVCARVCVLQMCNYFFKMSLVALCVCVCACVCVCVCLSGAGSASLPSPGWLAFDASYLIIPHSHANEAKDQGCDGWTGGVRGGAVGARCSVSLAILTHTYRQTSHQEHHKWEGQWTQLNFVEHSGSHCHKWVSCSWLIGCYVSDCMKLCAVPPVAAPYTQSTHA